MATKKEAFFHPKKIYPTSEQLNIQLASNRIVLAGANAGAAKTTTLVLRIGEAIERGVWPQSILALVFTVEARDVMRQRLFDLGVRHADRIKVITVDEYAQEMLETRIHNSPVLHMKRAEDLKDYVIEAVHKVGKLAEQRPDKYDFLDLRTHSVAISQFLDGQLNVKMRLAREQPALEDICDVEERAAFLGITPTDYLILVEYERIRGALSDDILSDSVRFRGSYDATYDLARGLHYAADDVKGFLPQYRLVVCDEMHDMNEASFTVLKALISQPQCYFVGAGDKDQVIYSKLGADSVFMESRFSEFQPSPVSYPLTDSYRYGPYVAYTMEEFKGKAISSRLAKTSHIVELHYPKEDECASLIVQMLQKLELDKQRLDDCAILIRDRHQSIPIENALIDADIHYQTLDMKPYMQRDEILFLRGMVAAAFNNLDKVKSTDIRAAIFEALMIFGESELPKEEFESIKKEILKHPRELGWYWFSSGPLRSYREEGVPDRVSETINYIKEQGEAAAAVDVLRQVCKIMDLDRLTRRIYIHPADIGVVSKTIEGFIKTAEKNSMSVVAFFDSISARENYLTNRRNRKNAVLLERIASVKGKEYDQVIMPFLEAGEFPSRLGSLKEEENLFYVGITRVKSDLTLLSPEDETKRSPFIKRMRLHETFDRANEAVISNEEQDNEVATRRYDLNVPFAEKDLIKAMGAAWDAVRKVWYLREGMPLKPFKQWLRR